MSDTEREKERESARRERERAREEREKERERERERERARARERERERERAGEPHSTCYLLRIFGTSFPLAAGTSRACRSLWSYDATIILGEAQQTLANGGEEKGKLSKAEDVVPSPARRPRDSVSGPGHLGL